MLLQCRLCEFLFEKNLYAPSLKGEALVDLRNSLRICEGCMHKVIVPRIGTQCFKCKDPIYRINIFDLVFYCDVCNNKVEGELYSCIDRYRCNFDRCKNCMI